MRFNPFYSAMKKKLAIIASVIFIPFGFASNGFGQWMLVAHPFHEIPHPPGGGVHTFAIQDSTIFAGGFTGVFRSTDNGVHWDSAGFIGQNINALLIDGSNIISGNEGRYNTASLFLTSDQGESWITVDFGLHGSFKWH
jgi:hypothetical protein